VASKNEQMLTKNLDFKDINILNTLLENARLSAREIAKKTRMSVVTVLNRMKRLEKNGVINSYTTSIDYEKIGYDVQAIIELRISKGKLFEMEEKIATHKNVFAIYDVTGDVDAIVIAKFKNRISLDRFLKKIQKYDFIERTTTKLILNTIVEKMVEIN
jgi:DNA-binding Lrp family transcriptional regulator